MVIIYYYYSVMGYKSSKIAIDVNVFRLIFLILIRYSTLI